MKKTLIIASIVAAILAAYYLFRGKKQGTTENDSPPPPPPPPPQTGGATGLYSPDTGEGGAAVKMRVQELLLSSAVRQEITPGLNVAQRLTNGMAYSGDFFLSNLSDSTGSVAGGGIPVVLSAAQKNAVADLQKVKYLSAANYWPTLSSIVTAAQQVRGAMSGARLLNENMYSTKDLNPIRNDYIGRIILKQSGIEINEKGYVQAAKIAVDDINKLGENWLSIAADAEKAIREMAIQDLRKTGWKFIGYDKPN